MNALLTVSVAANSPHDVLVQLVDTQPKERGYKPITSKVLRMKPRETHELAVSPGLSLCLQDAGAPGEVTV